MVSCLFSPGEQQFHPLNFFSEVKDKDQTKPSWEQNQLVITLVMLDNIAVAVKWCWVGVELSGVEGVLREPPTVEESGRKIRRIWHLKHPNWNRKREVQRKMSVCRPQKDLLSSVCLLRRRPMDKMLTCFSTPPSEVNLCPLSLVSTRVHFDSSLFLASVCMCISADVVNQYLFMFFAVPKFKWPHHMLSVCHAQ